MFFTLVLYFKNVGSGIEDLLEFLGVWYDVLVLSRYWDLGNVVWFGGITV